MSNSLISNGAWFAAHPEKILGEPYITTDPYKKDYTRWRGDWKKALQALALPAYQVDSSHSALDTSFVATQTPILLPTAKDAIATALKNLNKDRQVPRASVEPENASPLLTFDEVDALYNAHLSTDDKQAFVWYQRKVLQRPMEGGWRKYHLPEDQERAALDRWVRAGVCAFDGENVVPMSIFLMGNIVVKEERLKAKREIIEQKYGEEAFNALALSVDEALQNQRERWLKLDDPAVNERLVIKPTDEIAQSYQIKRTKSIGAFVLRTVKIKNDRRYNKPDLTYGAMNLKPVNPLIDGVYVSAKDALDSGDEALQNKVRQYLANQYDFGATLQYFESISLQEAFVIWLVSSLEGVKYALSWKDVYEIGIKNISQPDHITPEEWVKKKRLARAEAQRLFGIFLAQEVMDEDRVKLENEWNRKYNAVLPVDHWRIPIGFPMARFFQKEPNEIRAEKREAIAIAQVTGSLCVAYGVGLGKTRTAIFIVAQFLENGWATRPVIATPLQVYGQFMRECRGILPHIRINDLENLRASIQEEYVHTNEDGSLEPLPSGSISFLTYEGLKRLGLSERTSNELLPQVENILREGNKDKKRSSKAEAKDTQKNQQRAEHTLGKALTGGEVNADDWGIDMLVVDEAHNCKKVFTNVAAQETMENGNPKKEYNISSGSPSILALKTFLLSQYLNENQLTGNVLLLSATPFANIE